MGIVAHINVSDRKKKIYCYAQNKIVDFNDILKQCGNCKFFSGTAQGQGIECSWEDSGINTIAVGVYFPQSEYNRVNKR